MRSRARKSSGKGKTVSFIDGPLQPPSAGLLSEDTDMSYVGNSEDLVERLQELERELYDYQYNMGLLLIEKKERTLKHEQLQQSFVEVVEILKREKASHSIEVSQEDNREADLRKVLDVEIQGKMLVADKMLAEANRKSLELDKKLQEIERRESVLKREFVSLNSGGDVHEATFLKDKEDVDKREEKKAESLRSKLEIKEKELIALTEKLSAKERVEIQKLLDEHKSALEMKRQVLELEFEEKRMLLDEEMRVKHDNLDRKAREMNCMEEKLKQREQTLENKLNEVKAKEKEIELKVKDFKEKDKSLKVERKNLELLRSKVFSEKESMQILEDELERMKTEISQKEARIHDEIENLGITEAEKNEHIRLQIELKQEIARYNQRNDLILKKSEDLKNDGKKFEERWEILEEKREQVTKDSRELEKEKIMIEKLKLSGENQLKEEKLSTDDYIKGELESLRLEKESFALDKQKLDEQQAEIYKDIDELGVFSQKLKLQRQQLIDERSGFLEFVETFKNCQKCGEMAKDYVLSDFHIIEEEHLEKAASYKMDNMKTKSGRISWLLKKCTPRIFNLSPNRIVRHFTPQKLDQTENVEEPITTEGYFEVQEVLEDSKKSRGPKANIVSRKRSRPQPSRIRGTDDTDDSEWFPESESESDTESTCSKRRQIDALVVPHASEIRYNLRRNRPGGIAIASSTESESETDKVGDANLSTYDEISSAQSRQVSSNNDTNNTIHTQILPSTKAIVTSSADVADITDDVNSTPEKIDERDRGSSLNGRNEYDDYTDENPGGASATKKIWTFFTS